VIGKITFEHLALCDYSLALEQEFNPIRKWIRMGGENKFVIFWNTLLRNKKALDLEYKPFHYIFLRFKGNCLTAIVCLFSLLKFSVLLAENIKKIDSQFLEVIQNYHVYDLKRKSVFAVMPPDEYRKTDNIYLDVITAFTKHKIKM